MKLSELAIILDGTLKGADATYSRVVIDSRIVQAGDCFFAIKGDVFDGHDFLAQVADKKAAVAIVDRDITLSIPAIRVQSTREALKNLAAYYRDQVSIPVIGITGSCGKTTTRALVESILKQSGNVLASQKSFNNDIGLPLTLFQLKPSHDFAVLEIGTNHPGEIANLTKIAKPSISVVTMVAPVHVGHFGSVAAIAEEKSTIYDNAAISVINVDDPFRETFQSHISKNSITFGIKHQADVMASHIECIADKPVFRLNTAQGEVVIALPLLGVHNIVNALAAAAIAVALNIPLEKIKRGLEIAMPEHGRLNIKKGMMGETIIDDSYNANPASVMAAIDLLKTYQNPILVLGDMAELGEIAASEHVKIGDYAKAAGITALYCYGPLSQHAADAFGENAQYFETQAALLAALKAQLTKSTTVLVKGSNSMKMTNIVRALIQDDSHSYSR